jgi:hypothetical protein
LYYIHPKFRHVYTLNTANAAAPHLSLGRRFRQVEEIMNTLLRALVAQSVAVAVVALAAFAPSAASGATIAHWSFDSYDVDNNRYADETGMHHAEVVTNGTGAITNEPGAFGNAITSNNAPGAQSANNAYLRFSNLTELMGPEAGSYSVSAWVKTNNTTANNPILADWGNALPNTRRWSYWFSTNNASGASRPRGQSRAANAPVDPANVDIYARQLGTGNLADNAWHHIAWTWDKENTVLRTYVDGVLADTNDVTPTSADMLVSDSIIGTIGRKADDNRHFVGSLDEIWVVEGVLSDAEVASLHATNVVPEPSSLALIAAAGLLIAARRRR